MFPTKIPENSYGPISGTLNYFIQHTIAVCIVFIYNLLSCATFHAAAAVGAPQQQALGRAKELDLQVLETAILRLQIST
jgi:hypothetical protein